jgi:peptidoglycan/LPS O-acetylase OafA/YrhL
MLIHKQQNNFDLVRLFLAAAVVITHLVSILQGDFGVLKLFSILFPGERAVECFFVISGFLIFRSYWGSRNLVDYAARRARRIYPGLIAVVLVSAVAGAALSTLSIRDYYDSWNVIRYIFYNFVFMTFAQRDLPGVFQNMADSYVNGPLWTLKIEVLFYMSVPILTAISFRYIRFPMLAVIIYILSIIYHLVLVWLSAFTRSPELILLSNQLPGQMSFFMAGGLIAHTIDNFRAMTGWLVPVSISVFGLYVGSGTLSVLFYFFYPAVLAIIVIYICVVARPLIRATKYGDFSYGLYIVHWPILQTFGTLHLLEGHPIVLAIAALSCCFLAAVLSWHLVEKHWLRPAAPILPIHRVSRLPVGD